MKKVKRLIILLLAVVIVLSACSMPAGMASKEEKLKPGILLCGEMHSDDISIENELKLWGEYYAKGARHLFIECSYAEGCFLNEWMKAEDDEILDQIWADTEGTQGCQENTYNFWKTIKKDYPETIFHATDIGHQYGSIGKRYLEFLEANGRKDTEEYELVMQDCKQGEKFYELGDKEGFDYREECMISNFIREYEKVKDEFVMGIYGDAHVDLEGEMYYGTGKMDNMGKQLKAKYGDLLTTVCVYYAEPVREDEIEVAGKTYKATYYGSKNVEKWNWNDYVSLDYWRLEDAYEDFKDCRANYGMSLYYYDFPMKVELNQIFIVDFTLRDGTVERMYMRSDGLKFEGCYAVTEIEIE